MRGKVRTYLVNVITSAAVAVGGLVMPVQADEKSINPQSVKALIQQCLVAVEQGNAEPFSDWTFAEVVGKNERRVSPDENYRVFFGETNFMKPVSRQLHNCGIGFEGPMFRGKGALSEIARVASSLVGTEFGGVAWRKGRVTRSTGQPKAQACVNGYTLEVFADLVAGAATPYLKVGYSFVAPGPCE